MLSRKSTARVLQSLIQAELKTLRDRFGASGYLGRDVGPWSHDLSLRSGDTGSLGLDSLELMAIGAAINEMFHLYESPRCPDLLDLDTFGDWIEAIESAWEDGVSKITFLTSGSTGVPKRCVHEIASLIEEAKFLAELFRSRCRIIALAPAHHIYGCLMTAFVADQMDVDVILAAECSSRFLNSELLAGDLLVSFPDKWAALDRIVAVWPGDVEGVVSTAPCPASLISSLQQRGLSGMTELYGSTETAGIGWRRHPDVAFSLMPCWRFLELDEQGDEGVELLGLNGLSYLAPDSLERQSAREFTVGARRDGALQVGGVNVWPIRIAAELERHPKVKSASVRLKPSQAGGRLKAFIVPLSPVLDINLRSELEIWCRQHFSPAECPRSWSFGDELPTSDLGKTADWVESDWPNEK